MTHGDEMVVGLVKAMANELRAWELHNRRVLHGKFGGEPGDAVESLSTQALLRRAEAVLAALSSPEARHDDSHVNDGVEWDDSSRYALPPDGCSCPGGDSCGCFDERPVLLELLLDYQLAGYHEHHARRAAHVPLDSSLKRVAPCTDA